MNRPELRTSRLLLRAFVPADAQAVASLAGDRRVAEMTLTVPHPYQVHHAEGWIASQEAQWQGGTAAVLAVCQIDGPLVGAIGLEISKLHERAELGYWIGVPYWGRGYATEASLALVCYGFETLHLNRIFAAHYAGNPASGRVLQKVGLKHEGVARQHIKRMGVFHDSAMYGVTRAEWEVTRSSPPAQEHSCR